MGIISRFPMGAGGGNSLPDGWIEEVISTARYAISEGDPIEYRRYPGEDTFAAGVNPTSSPGSLYYTGAAFSPDNTYLALMNDGYSQTSYVRLLKKDAATDSYVEVSSASFSKYYSVNASIAWSPNGDFIAIAHTNASNTYYKYVTIYAVENDVLVSKGTATSGYIEGNQADPNSLALAWHPDSTSIVVLANNCWTDYSSYAYYCNASLFSVSNEGVPSVAKAKLFNSDNYVYKSGSGSAVYLADVAFTLDGDYLIIGGSYGTYVYSFANNTVAFKYSAGIACSHILIEPDVNSALIIYPSSPYVRRLSLVNGTWSLSSAGVVNNVTATPFASNAQYPNNIGYDAYSLSSDGQYLFVNYTNNLLYVYKRQADDTFTLLSSYGTSKTSNYGGFAVPSRDGTYIVTRNRNDTAVGITLWVTGTGDFIVPMDNVLTSKFLGANPYSYYGMGYAKTSAAEGEEITVGLFTPINSTITGQVTALADTYSDMQAALQTLGVEQS